MNGPTNGDMCSAPVVVIGASAGGVEALQRFVGLLPPDLGAALLVVLHVSPSGMSLLPDILTRAGALPAVHAQDGDKLREGRILVAPPDRHLTIDGVEARVTMSPRENGHRPAIDPLFRSAAYCYGRHAIGVLLSGMLDDGVAGLAEIAAAGGTTLVQDPAEAAYPSMPLHAIQRGAATHVLPLVDIAATVVECANSAGTPPLQEVAMPLDAPASPFPAAADDIDGEISAFTCPSCGGTLWLNEDSGLIRFRCRTGHVYSAESMLDSQAESLDDALWGAYRSLLERADLSQRMAKRARARGAVDTTARYTRIAEESERRARVLHRALVASEEAGQPSDEATR